MIHFHTQDINFSLKNKTLLKRWVSSTIEKKRCKTGELNFIFCSDDYLLNMNKQYLGHDTYTDIITFDYSQENVKKVPPEKGGSGISGDIYISIDRVKENALKFSKSFNDELHRVLIHGTLHLLGYKDKTKNAKAEMTRQENLCLASLKKL